MHTIIVPLDGSQLAEQALPAARMFAALLGARLHLLRVVTDDMAEPVESEQAMLSQYADPLTTTHTRGHTALERAHRHADDYLQYEAHCLEQAGFPTKYGVCGGDPAQLIADFAASEHASLIAMTTHGYSGLQRFTLGSVASKVVQASRVPVLLLRGSGHWRVLAHTPRRIIVPLDGSEHARAALPFALDIARLAGAELVLFQAIAPLAADSPGLLPILTEEDYRCEQTALHKLNYERAQFSTPDVVTSSLVTFGEPAPQIAQVATWQQADLIVMATHGRSGVARWALGSVADAVLHTSEVPLVLIRPQMK